jgi:hypothetical protein
MCNSVVGSSYDLLAKRAWFKPTGPPWTKILLKRAKYAANYKSEKDNNIIKVSRFLIS